MKKDGPPPPPPQALTSNMAAHKQEICHGLCRSRLRVVAFGSVLLLLVVGGAVAGIYLIQQEQKRQQGASAPEAIKAQAGEDIMRQRAHGTCLGPVQKPLRWSSDWETADRISCFNRHWAERAGYWETTSFFKEEGREVKIKPGTTIFYDSVTSEPLFQAPVGRSWTDFVHESEKHGWPSFRDAEVISDRLRVLSDGETVSLDGTHLGHNLPDSKGNRYCINLVSVAGYAPNTPEGIKAQKAIDWDAIKV